MQRFKKVMTIEGNWCDDPKDKIIDENNRRYSALAMLLRVALPGRRRLLERGPGPADQARHDPPRHSRKAATALRSATMTIAATECLLRMYDEQSRARGLSERRAALVHRLRRQRHPRRGAAAVPRRGSAAGEDRVRLRHRLLEPLSALHEDLRLPRHPRPRAAGRRGRQDGAAGPQRVRQHRRRRLLQHRRGALDPRHPLQHEHDRDAARQSDLRSDQDAGLADLAEGNEEQHHAARLLSRRAAIR